MLGKLYLFSSLIIVPTYHKVVLRYFGCWFGCGAYLYSVHLQAVQPVIINSESLYSDSYHASLGWSSCHNVQEVWPLARWQTLSDRQLTHVTKILYQTKLLKHKNRPYVLFPLNIIIFLLSSGKEFLYVAFVILGLRRLVLGADARTFQQRLNPQSYLDWIEDKDSQCWLLNPAKISVMTKQFNVKEHHIQI